MKIVVLKTKAEKPLLLLEVDTDIQISIMDMAERIDTNQSYPRDLGQSKHRNLLRIISCI